MKTPLNATYSKWATYTPRWPGDLISNLGCYPIVPVDPDNLDDYWKMQAANAEHFANTESRTHFFYNANGVSQAMLYGSASSGYDAWDIAASFPEAILNHAEDLTGEQFITTQALARGALDPEIVKPDIFEKNDRANRGVSDIAAQHNKHLYVVGPNHREHFTRDIKHTYPILFGSSYEDLTFEVHYWGPFLFHDASQGIRARDAAWSNNAPLEQAIALAVQFGLEKPLLARGGEQYDVTDIYGRPVSLVDQAWEAARHVVDIATREVRHDGDTYQFRTEKGVALLLTYFMYNAFYKNDHEALDRNKAHEIIKSHYADEKETAAFDNLKEMMLPFLAEYCDWQTLHNILDRDPDLKQFWEEQVVPNKGNTPDIDQIKREVLGFVPRGGFDHKKLRDKAGCEITYRDPEGALRPNPAQYQSTPKPLGLHEGSFTSDWEPKIFNDRNFARLGNTESPDTDPDSNRLTREQVAAIVILHGMRDSGKRPELAPRTLFYVDDADTGDRAAYYRYIGEKKIQDPGELGARFDPLAEGGKTYTGRYGAENAADLQDRVHELGTGCGCREWREHYGVGNIVPSSDVKAASDFLAGYREALDTEMHMAIQQPGPVKVPGSVVETVGRRLIDMELDGLVVPNGPLSGAGYRYMVEGVLAAMGLTPRPYSGGKYRFEIFLDHDYLKPPEYRRAPNKMDLGDIFIHLGLQAKYHLDQPGAPTDRDLLVSTARVCDLLEKVMDPGRRNIKACMDPKTGQASEEPIIDLNQVDPELVDFARYSPGMPDMVDADGEMQDTQDLYQQFVQDPAYKAFKSGELDLAAYTNDPVKKGELIRMMWFYLRADRELMPKAPVSGRMLQKGVDCFDKFDLRDLPDEYDDARDWLGNMQSKERERIFRQGVRHVQGPVPSVR